MDNSYLKELQKIELEILLEVDRICKKHNIAYFLVSGTLLGAIRHKGFIPWDDDIDICMPIDDYKKFCKVSAKELDDAFFLQNFETDNTNKWAAKIRKNGTTVIEKGYENADIHQGAWIDIFPLIGINDDETWITRATKKSDWSKKLLRKRYGALGSFKTLSFDKKILKFLPFKFVRFIVKLLLSTIFKNHKSFKYCTYLWGNCKISPRFSSDIFEGYCEVEFEGYLFPAPAKWNEYLSIVYGDYMTLPPPEKRNGGCHTIAIVDLKNDYKKYVRTK
ncbi:MAG: LicD family protein [Clostridia bacterium]|nr:LicD family protein [Clostridia bacterium]